MTCKCTDLDTLLVEPEVVHFAAAVCVCRQSLQDFVPDLESQANSDSTQNVIDVIIKTLTVFACCKKPNFVVFFIGNNGRLKLLL